MHAVYLLRKEPSLREFLVRWRNIKPRTTGNDLKERGLEPGPKFATVLQQLRAAWLDGDVTNMDEEKALLENLIQ